ncbi:MAG: hypothetical protein QME90_10805 [Thermodesulfobacteriota bacterium]|nr:hypothetical protein [Thermodesulfobacteriota bacterium]
MCKRINYSYVSLRARRACLHAEVPAYAETLRAGRRYGTQAKQSRFFWDCFVVSLLAMADYLIAFVLSKLSDFLDNARNFGPGDPKLPSV